MTLPKYQDGPSRQRVSLLQLHRRIGVTKKLLTDEDWAEVDAYLMAVDGILARHDPFHLTEPITDSEDDRFDAAVTGLQAWKERNL